MGESIDIYGYNTLLDQGVRRIANADTSERNKELILKFKDYCLLQRMSKGRIIRYLNVLKHTSIALGKDFDKADRQDIEKLVAWINNRNLSTETAKLYKIMLRRFYKWLKGNDEEYPPEVKWIKAHIKLSEKELPSEGELITEDEVKKLIGTARHSRDRALISLLYESGCRISEIGTMKIGNISFDNYGLLISVKGKTGMRKIRVIFSVPYITAWLNDHPYRNDAECPLWIGISTNSNGRKEAVKYTSLLNLLKRCFEKSGIKKRSNPHFLRHSRATFMANHLTEFQMNQYFGWIQGSRMPSIYVHLSGRETDKAILELNGINVKKEQKESSLKPQKCPRCDIMNSHDSKYCSKCAGPLDIRSLIEQEEKRENDLKVRSSSDLLMNKIIQDPEIKRLIAKKLSELDITP